MHKDAIMELCLSRSAIGFFNDALHQFWIVVQVGVIKFVDYELWSFNAQYVEPKGRDDEQIWQMIYVTDYYTVDIRDDWYCKWDCNSLF